MDAVLKRRIVNIFSDTLAFVAMVMAICCLFVRLKSINLPDISSINILAVKSMFPRGNMDILPDFKDNFLKNSNKDYIENIKGNTNVKAPSSLDKIISENISLPEPPKFSEHDSENHSPSEQTHKVIESQFGSGGIKFENFYVKNTTGQNLNIGAQISKRPDIKITDTSQPQVLIFHTHTSESYMDTDEGFFYESFYPRSLENDKNVTRVGKAITDKLIEHGINTVHDITYHDNPTYNGSYARAAKTIQKNLEEHPSIQVVIDIHRDSLGSKETGKIKPTFKYNNKKAAQLMIISGCDSDNSLGFPNWEKNLCLALRLQKYCENLFPGITRPLNFSKVKYNEHLTPGSLLIEVGSDVNTLEEAVYTGSMLGESLSKLLCDLKT